MQHAIVQRSRVSPKFSGGRTAPRIEVSPSADAPGGRPDPGRKGGSMATIFTAAMPGHVWQGCLSRGGQQVTVAQAPVFHLSSTSGLPSPFDVSHASFRSLHESWLAADTSYKLPPQFGEAMRKFFSYAESMGLPLYDAYHVRDDSGGRKRLAEHVAHAANLFTSPWPPWTRSRAGLARRAIRFGRPTARIVRLR